MTNVDILQAQRDLDSLVDALLEGAESEIVITRDGQPVANLVGIDAPHVPADSVFEDLGLPDAKTHAVKTALVAHMQALLKSAPLDLAEASKIAGADLAPLLGGQFRDTSMQQLLEYLTRLGCEIDIIITPPNGEAFAPIHLEAKSAL